MAFTRLHFKFFRLKFTNIQCLLNDFSLPDSMYRLCGMRQQNRHVPRPSILCSGFSCQRSSPTSFFRTNCLPAASDALRFLILTKWRLFTISQHQNVPTLPRSDRRMFGCHFSRCVHWKGPCVFTNPQIQIPVSWVHSGWSSSGHFYWTVRCSGLTPILPGIE